MPNSSSKARSWLGFVVVILVIVIVSWTLFSVGSSNTLATVSSEMVPNPSVENSRGSGSKGFYDWTKTLGYKPKVFSDGFGSLPQDATILVCIAPNMTESNPFNFSTSANPDDEGGTVNKNPLSYTDGLAVRKWVESGHTLLLLASSLPDSTASAYEKTYSSSTSSGPKSFAAVLGVFPQSAIQNEDRHQQYHPLQPTKWTEGVDSIQIHKGYRLYDPDHHGFPLFSDIIVHNSSSVGSASSETKIHAYPVAEVYTIGKGRVVAISDDFFACNRNLLRADNAAFLYRIITLCARPGDTILFDEVHQAYGVESPSMWLALSKSVRYATLQLVIVLVVAFIVLVPRIGQPVPFGGTKGRSSAEYVTSLAGLYQSAGVTTTALETIYRQFLREVCQKFGLPTDTTLERMAEVAARRGGVDVNSLKKLLVSCEKCLVAPVAINGRDLVTLARAIERYRKELGIG